MEDKIKYYNNKIKESKTLSEEEQKDDYVNLWEIYGDDENSTDILIAHCKYRMEKKYSKLFYSLSFDYDLEDLLDLCRNRKLNSFQLSEIEDLVVRYNDMLDNLKLCIDEDDTTNHIEDLYELICEKNNYN